MARKFRDPVTTIPMNVSKYLHFKNEFKVDRTYQREEAWERADEQWFIDSLLRNLPIPIIFIHKKDEIKWIVDGQQRLNTIWKFFKDKIELNEKISGDIIRESNGGKTYSDLHDDYKQNFMDYPLPIIYLNDYTDEEIRGIYRRLQRGKPLNVAEILNAYPGNIVLTMRKLASHPFFREVSSIKGKRYKYLQLAAIILYLNHEGIKDISPKKLYDFFDNNPNLKSESEEYRKANRVLNYLKETFQTKTPELSRPAWCFTLYLMTSYLLDNYAMKEQKKNLKNFIYRFYQDVSNSSTSGDAELIDFNLFISKGTTGEKSLKKRHNIILKRFLKNITTKPLDENRIFTEDQKREIFRRDGEKCTICEIKLKWGDVNTHYHHKDQWIKGGKTIVNRGQLVCKNCHLKDIHGKK